MKARQPASKFTGYYIALIALIVAAIYSFVIFSRIAGPQHVVLDPDQHGNLAYGILKNHSFSYYPDPQPTVERGPAYPAFIALVLIVTNDWWPYSVQLAQCILFALICLMVYWMSSVLWNRQAGAVIALICAIHPLLIWYTSRIWVETISTFLFTSLIAASLYFHLRPTLARAALVGCVLAASALCKATFLVYTPLVPILLLVIRGRKDIRLIAASLLVAIALISPWTYRNWRLTGHFIPIHVRTGFNVRVGDRLVEAYASSPFSLAKLWENTASISTTRSKLTGMQRWQREMRLDEILARESKETYRRHPWFLPRKILLDAWMFWTLGETNKKSLVISILLVPLAILFARSTIMIVRTGKARSIQGMHVAMVLVYYAMHLPIQAIARYSIVLVPTMLMYALAPIIEPFVGRITRVEGERKRQA